jgi:hypothetical protein
MCNIVVVVVVVVVPPSFQLLFILTEQENGTLCDNPESCLFGPPMCLQAVFMASTISEVAEIYEPGQSGVFPR